MGLIPAGAGQTGSHGVTPQHLRAHPRWRGADTATLALAAAVFGSSPLARGRLPPGYRRLLREGLIPAGAGQTW